MRILVVVGTRPEAIKLGPVVAELRRRGIAPVICASGQHGELLDRALSSSGLVADFGFEPLRVPGLALMTEALVARAASVIGKVRPDWVIVQGDTTTAFAAALAASAEGVPVAHVEAGLRTGDLTAPFPEEGHRRAIATTASLHFAPTVRAAGHLAAEGVAAEAVAVTGNTAVDAVLDVCRRLDSDPGFARSAAREIASVPADRRIIVLTGHRRENHGEAFAEVGRGMAAVARRGDAAIVHIAHPNPDLADFHAALAQVPGLLTLPPLSHPAFVTLMRRAYAIVTDSGGLQEEAPSLGVPLLVTRRSTERPEAIDEGAARLVGTSAGRIEAELGRLLDDPADYAAMARPRSPFGDGKAAIRIVDRLVDGHADPAFRRGKAHCPT